MSEEATPTRAEAVAASFEAAVAQYGNENYMKILMVVLKDISVSCGMIADNTTPADS